MEHFKSLAFRHMNSNEMTPTSGSHAMNLSWIPEVRWCDYPVHTENSHLLNPWLSCNHSTYWEKTQCKRVVVGCLISSSHLLFLYALFTLWKGMKKSKAGWGWCLAKQSSVIHTNKETWWLPFVNPTKSSFWNWWVQICYCRFHNLITHFIFRSY